MSWSRWYGLILLGMGFTGVSLAAQAPGACPGACPGARPGQPRYDLRPVHGLFPVRQWRVAQADDDPRGLFVVRRAAGAGRSQ
jgi:hypothetical protein